MTVRVEGLGFEVFRGFGLWVLASRSLLLRAGSGLIKGMALWVGGREDGRHGLSDFMRSLSSGCRT